MKVIVHPADLALDRELLIDTLLRYLTPRSNAARFDWLYKNNPHGPARVWIARDSTTGTVVGTASAFPRCMSVDGYEEKGWVLGDFCIHEQYRSLGPALQLQRACLAEVEAGTIAFCYDFPSTSMMAVYKRLRINPCGHMLRLVKHLRVDRKVAEFVHNPVLARSLNAVGNTFLALRQISTRSSRDVTLSLHEGACGAEFSALVRAVGSRDGVYIQRSAAYLNWRYVANPLDRYELLTARRAGALWAYAVFSHTGDKATLVDLYGHEDVTVLSCLVDGLVALLWQRGVVTVIAPMLEHHPWVGLLQRLGFRAREARPMVVCAAPDSRVKRNAVAHRNWSLMQGDRDS
jgi:hypothetical protein